MTDYKQSNLNDKYLSLLTQEEIIHTNKVSNIMKSYIGDSSNNHISFDFWMDKVLYMPELGYYDSSKFRIYTESKKNKSSDYITAPELDSIFAHSLSNQIEEILEICGTNSILEFGAGNGSLAHDIMQFFNDRNIKIDYYIIEISNTLINIQKEKLNKFSSQVHWIKEPPINFIGCIVANEFLDAIPVSIFKLFDNKNIKERCITLDKYQNFIWKDIEINSGISNLILNRIPNILGYTSEINFKAEQWISDITNWLEKGVVLLIDYGFPRYEYYHPQRNKGTLMCHVKHYAHDDPLIIPGEQDITAHIDFTSIAESAINTDLNILGYTSQSNFLINSGILDLLSNIDRTDSINYLHKTNAVKKLITETEMGELFKVIAIGKNLKNNLIGFKYGNRLNNLMDII